MAVWHPFVHYNNKLSFFLAIGNLANDWRITVFLMHTLIPTTPIKSYKLKYVDQEFHPVLFSFFGDCNTVQPWPHTTANQHFSFTSYKSNKKSAMEQ